MLKVESATTPASSPRLKADGDVKEDKDSMAAAAAEAAAAAAIAVARTEAYESVKYEGEESGGAGIELLNDTKTAREWRAMLQKAVLEHGVGSWQATVRWHDGLVLWCIVRFPQLNKTRAVGCQRDQLHVHRVCTGVYMSSGVRFVSFGLSLLSGARADLFAP